MSNTSFSHQVADWVQKVKGATEAVFKESAQDVVEEMQKVGYSVAATRAAISKGIGTTGRGKKKKQIAGPVAAAGEGGNMPVDTGFLRASLKASTSAMPRIKKGSVPKEGKKYTFDEDQIEMAIAGTELGQTIHFGYTAAYAAAVNYGANGQQPRQFVNLAGQKWNQFVDARTAGLKSKLGL